MVKRKPHHPLAGIKAKFATTASLEITSTAVRSAAALGYDLDAVAGVVQTLQTADFIKSETAHSPPNSKVWHDSYRTVHDELELYRKFAGETLIDLALTSFKEA